jgi:hypothetical protein
LWLSGWFLRHMGPSRNSQHGEASSSGVCF